MSSLSPASIPAEKFQPYHEKVYRQADRIARNFIIGFFAVGIALSFIHETYLLAILMGGLSVGLFFLIRTLSPSSAWSRLATGFLFWNFGLQYLFEMHGLFEAHFVFFIALTALLFYEDWRVIVPPTAYAVATAVFLFVFQDGEFVKQYFPALGSITVMAFITHLIALIFYSGLCIAWSALQRGQTRESAAQAIGSEMQLGLMDINIAFANSISEGDLKSSFTVAEGDRLGTSLLNMRDSLRVSALREEQEKFSTAGLARTGEILRQNADNLEKLSDQVLEELVHYMKANQGSLFVMEQSGTDNAYLRLAASRAWDRKKFTKKTVAIGEGLIGQAAIEKQTIFLKKVPDNYITITSGLGESNPNCILIVPLKSEDVVTGVIELASFKIFEDYEIRFLEKVAESIASMVLTTRNNEKTKELLEKANVLAEQLRSQEEEIRQNMEEMQATQEEMARKNREIERLLETATTKEKLLEEKLQEIEIIKREEQGKSEENLAYLGRYKQTLLNIMDQLPHKIFLKDHEGKMVIVNTVVAKAHQMTVDELVGKSDFDFVDAATAQEWRNQELEIIRKGSETYIFNEDLSGQTVTLKSTKMAFYIPHLDQTGLLGIQTDITELQKLKTEAEENSRVKK